MDGWRPGYVDLRAGSYFLIFRIYAGGSLVDGAASLDDIVVKLGGCHSHPETGEEASQGSTLSLSFLSLHARKSNVSK